MSIEQVSYLEDHHGTSQVLEIWTDSRFQKHISSDF